jgi:hypothetical protein
VSISIEEVRRIDQGIVRGQAEAELRQALLQKLKAEEDAYLELLNRKGRDDGWRVVSKDTLHRIGAKNAEIEAVIRAKTVEYPLMSKIITHGGFEWWMTRDIGQFSDAELLSDPRYLRLFDKAVGRRECSDRPWLREQKEAVAGD